MASHTDADKGVITLHFKGCSNFPVEMPRALEGIMNQQDWNTCIVRINRLQTFFFMLIGICGIVTIMLLGMMVRIRKAWIGTCIILPSTFIIYVMYSCQRRGVERELNKLYFHDCFLWVTGGKENTHIFAGTLKFFYKDLEQKLGKGPELPPGEDYRVMSNSVIDIEGPVAPGYVDQIAPPVYVDPPVNPNYEQVEGEGQGTYNPSAPEGNFQPNAPSPPPPSYNSAPLPPGWRCLKAENGRPYYINDLTHETSWNPPSQTI